MKKKINKTVKTIIFITIIILTLIMSFVSVNAETTNKLNFDSVKVYVNDNKVDIDETIEVRDGDDVRIVVVLENKYSDDDDIVIEDAYFKIDSDGDWDFADGEKSDKQDIKENDEEEFEIEFVVDEDDVDDEKIDFKLLAYGDDEENSSFEHYDEETLEFELIGGGDGELEIKEVKFTEETLNCQDLFAYLSITVKNYGNDDQEKVVYGYDSESMGLKSSVTIGIDEGDEHTNIFKIPIHNLSGFYALDVLVYNDDWDETDSKKMYINIVCDAPVNYEDEEEDEDEGNNTPINVPENNNTNDDEDEAPEVIYNPGNLKYEEPVAGSKFFFGSIFQWLRNLFS